MARLAIKGHATRGKEVIEILGILGGSNAFGHVGNNPLAMYYIDENYKNFIICSNAETVCDCIIFTLEEFLEVFPYRVGNKVQHKGATSCGTVYIIERINWANNHIEYAIRPLYDYNHTGLVTVCIEDLQPYKEETMDKVNKAVFDANAQCCDITNRLIKEETMEDKGTLVQIDLTRELCVADEVEVILGDYEFVLKDGKTYFVKKKPQYPKTFIECAKILDCFGATHIDGYKCELLDNLQQLLICRDAYWMIYGEQMWLGKPWEPDYDSGVNKYGIISMNGAVQKSNPTTNWERHLNKVLEFPTEEMRDAFYENFKDLIEQCKELL